MTAPSFGQSNVASSKVLDFLSWACRSQDVLSGRPAENEAVLASPPIQRSAVWRPAQVLGLWDSLLGNLPIGMFYLLEEDREREVVVNNKVWVIKQRGYDLLDGQQRLRALALGAGDPFGEKRCLWVRFRSDDYELRLTSRAQPFGYDKAGKKLNSVERRTARESIEPNAKEIQLRFLQDDSVQPVYDADLFEKSVRYGNRQMLAPPYPYLCSS